MTDNQAKVLAILASEPPPEGGLWNPYEIAGELNQTFPNKAGKWSTWNEGQVRAVLVRLQRRGLVVRLNNRHMADDWRLT